MLDTISTTELLETLKKRGQLGVLTSGPVRQGYEHLLRDAEHLLGILPPEVLAEPYQPEVPE